MKRLFMLLCSIGMILLLAVPVWADTSATPVEDAIIEKYEALRQEMIAADERGEVDNLGLELRRIANQRTYEFLRSREYAWEKLSAMDADTPEYRAAVMAFADLTANDPERQEELIQYYADSQRTTVEELAGIPVFRFSEPIPMSSDWYLSIYGKGKLSAEDLQRYVCAWVMVVYADEMPFCVVQAARYDGVNYGITGAYPSPEQAESYEALLKTEGCYLTNAIIHPISYITVEQNEMKGIYQLEDGVVVPFLEGAQTLETYFMASLLAAEQNAAYAVEHPSVQMGGKPEQQRSYLDTWEQAEYELYIKPWLVPVLIGAGMLAVILVGVAIFRRMRSRRTS